MRASPFCRRGVARQLAKTDVIDARILAHFADAIRPEVRPISDESSRQLEDLVARRLLAHSLTPVGGAGSLVKSAT